jgi:hypothetical protein
MTAPQPGARDLTWSTWGQCATLIAQGRTVRPSAHIALVVGALLTVVNQFAVLASGDHAPATIARVGANYAIPYIVSSVGFLSSYRVSATAPASQG